MRAASTSNAVGPRWVRFDDAVVAAAAHRPRRAARLVPRRRASSTSASNSDCCAGSVVRGLLRMPLDADDPWLEASGPGRRRELDRLDEPVRGSAGRDAARRRPGRRPGGGATSPAGSPTSWSRQAADVGSTATVVHASRVSMTGTPCSSSPGMSGRCWMQRATERDVHDLHAAADAERRHPHRARPRAAARSPSHPGRARRRSCASLSGSAPYRDGSTSPPPTSSSPSNGSSSSSGSPGLARRDDRGPRVGTTECVDVRRRHSVAAVRPAGHPIARRGGRRRRRRAARYGRTRPSTRHAIRQTVDESPEHLAASLPRARPCAVDLPPERLGATSPTTTRRPSSSLAREPQSSTPSGSTSAWNCMAHVRSPTRIRLVGGRGPRSPAGWPPPGRSNVSMCHWKTRSPSSKWERTGRRPQQRWDRIGSNPISRDGGLHHVRVERPREHLCAEAQAEVRHVAIDRLEREVAGHLDERLLVGVFDVERCCRRARRRRDRRVIGPGSPSIASQTSTGASAASIAAGARRTSRPGRTARTGAGPARSRRPPVDAGGTEAGRSTDARSSRGRTGRRRPAG